MAAPAQNPPIPPEQIFTALLDAFRTYPALERMVSFKLNRSLRQISEAAALRDVVFALVQAADAEGWTAELIEGALAANPGNALLQALRPASPKAPQPASAANSTPAKKSMPKSAAGPVTVFFSYSHKDKALRDELATHLKLFERQGLLQGWHDRDIEAGREWKTEIDDHLEEAEVILLLVSGSFLASDYCYDIEMKRALERSDAHEARTIPIILRPCDWHSTPFGKLKALPEDGKPVTEWRDRDAAWTDVVKALRKVLEGLKRR